MFAASLTISAIVGIIVIVVAVIFAVQGYYNIISDLLLDGKQLSAKAFLTPSMPSSGLIQTIAIPNVDGRIDHMAIDIRGQRLFIAELGNNSLDVIDLKAAKRIYSISNNERLLNEPQSVVYIP